MRVSSSWASVVMLATCAATAQAQTYTIKLKTYPDAGMSVVVRDTSKETGWHKFFDAAGKLVDEGKLSQNEKLYTMTVLKRQPGDGLAQKYTRAYEKATETAGDKTRALSYQGRTIVFERKKDKYWVGVVGQPPLDREDLDKFIEQANHDPDGHVAMDKAITPPKPVAVGGSWKVDLKIVAADMKVQIDLKESRGEAKLAKVYMRGTSQFGLLEINMQLVLKGLGRGTTIDPPISMEVRGTIDTAIDGSSMARTEIFTLRAKGKTVFQAGETKLKMELDTETSGRMERSEEKKAKPQELPAVELTGPAGEWTELNSKPGRFSASFPGKPHEETTKDDKKVTTSFTATLEDGNIHYEVVLTEYAEDLSKTDPQLLLAGIADAFAKNTKKKQDIKLNGFPSVDLIMALDNKGTKIAARLRVYAVNGRLYQVMVLNELSLMDRVQAARFLDSFQLHEKKEEKKK